MFYVHQGDVHVTPAGQEVKEFKAWKKQCGRNKEYFNQTIVFLYYSHTRHRPPLFDNPYWGISPMDRREEVIEQFELFSKQLKKTDNVSEVWMELEDEEMFSQLLSFWRRSQGMSENELNAEAFRQKANYWRKQLMQMDNSTDQEIKIGKALESASKLAEQFRMAAEMEDSDDEEGINVPLYLFEIPEKDKPKHMRLKLK